MGYVEKSQNAHTTVRYKCKRKKEAMRNIQVLRTAKVNRIKMLVEFQSERNSEVTVTKAAAN